MNAATVLLAASLLALTSCARPDAEAAEKPGSGGVPGALEAVAMPGIEKVHAAGGVYLAGQPDEAGFRAAREGGIRTVINLRHDDEIELAERELVEGLGLSYVHLPWNGAEELTDAVFDRTRALLRDAEQPVLLHCKSANRVGAVWLPHRVLDGGVGLEEALEEARTVGLKSDEYEAKARDYIERRSR